MYVKNAVIFLWTLAVWKLAQAEKKFNAQLSRLTHHFNGCFMWEFIPNDWWLPVYFSITPVSQPIRMGVNPGVDGVVTTTPDFKVGRGDRGMLAKYYYILIIFYNVQEYEIKTRSKVVTLKK